MTPADSPLFVVGAPRSGTSVMRRIVNNHTSIALSDETHYFFHIYEPLAGDADANWNVAIDRFIEDCNRIQPLDYSAVASELKSLPGPDFRLLFQRPLQAWARAEGKSIWGEKTPRHIFFADVISRFFPDARFIVMLRDPRAVVASLTRFDMIPAKDCVFSAKRWLDIWSRGRRIVESAVPVSQRFVVRYEDLIAGPEATVRDICGFLGIDDQAPAMLDFYRGPGKSIQDRYDPKLSKPVGGDPFAWRRQLSIQEITAIEDVCGSVMEELGYPREGRQPDRLERAEIRAKLAYVTLRQRQHSGQRYHDVWYGPLTGLRRRVVPARSTS